MIRLQCGECDCGLDGIEQVPDGWEDVSEVQSYEASLEELPMPELLGSRIEKRSVFEWYTHLGTCPECVANERERHERT